MSANFTATIILLARICNLVGDKFFYDKFENKMRILLEDSIFLFGRGGDSVAQRQVLNERVLKSLNDVLEIIDELEYLSFLKASPLILEARKNLLLLKFEAVKSGGELINISAKKPEKHAEEKQMDDQIAQAKPVRKNLRLNQSKKKILEFIKASPNTRTKDIISEFNAMSDRTVKRNLTDLLHSGFIKKRVDNKAVYYYASE